jgi:hypothetical protein
MWLPFQKCIFQTCTFFTEITHDSVLVCSVLKEHSFALFRLQLEQVYMLPKSPASSEVDLYAAVSGTGSADTTQPKQPQQQKPVKGRRRLSEQWGDCEAGQLSEVAKRFADTNANTTC